MNLHDANRIARSLMNEHGLVDWSINWDNAKRRYGQCNYQRRWLSFSKPLTTAREEEAFRNTVLHEIAHALVGSGHGHDRVWAAKARSIGCSAQRCSDDAKIEAPWTGVHDGCAQTFARHRRPKFDAYCPKCFVQPKRPSIHDLMPVAPDNSRALIRWVATRTLQGA